MGAVTDTNKGSTNNQLVGGGGAEFSLIAILYKETPPGEL